MKAPVLVSVVVMLHVMAIGTLVFVQGCGTTQPRVEPGPAPVVMPPSTSPDEPVAPVAPGTLRPAIPEAPAPAPVPQEPVIGSYTIQKGDSLSKIAAKHGLSTRELAELNGIKDLNKVRVGQVLIIPGYSGGPAPVKPAGADIKLPTVSAAPAAKTLAGGEYVVKAGDSLGKIAQAHGVKIAAIKDANNLTSDKIRLGQKLVLPAGSVSKPKAVKKQPKKPVEDPANPAPVPTPAAEPVPVPPVVVPAPAAEPAPDVVAPPVPEMPVAPPPLPQLSIEPPAAPTAPAPTAPTAPAPALGGAPQPIKYPVSLNETVESIAKAFLVSPQAIRKLNSLAPDATLKPGQTILIPVPE